MHLDCMTMTKKEIMSKSITYSILIAGGLLALQPSLAHAADFGGDCCADLEERVAVLEATTARKGNRKVSLKIYGQVNRAILFWDNGREDDAYVVDNDSSTSRVGFRGKAKINSDWSAGYRIELGTHTSESDRVSEADDDSPSTREIVLRRNEMFIQSKTFGKISWGRTGHALDGTTTNDLSGTAIIARNGGLRFIEGFSIINANGTVNANADWDDVFPGDLEFDRDDVIRYDTPTLAGFRLSASWGEDDEYSFAAFYKGTWADFKIAAAAGYGIDEEGDRMEVYNGSLSVMHTPTGLWVTTSGGVREHDDSGSEEEFYQIKGGIQQKWVSLGKTTLYGEYISTDIDDVDRAGVTGAEGEIFGGGFVQKVDAAAMELYAGYRHYEADLSNGENVEDFQTFVTGARIKF